MAAKGYLRRLTRRLTEDPEQRDVEELSDEAVNTGAQRAIDCERGQEVTMVGTLRCVDTNAKGCPGGVRAAATAAPLARLTGLEVTLDKDLRERSGGDWEGLTDTEIDERYPRERASWDPPNGEPIVAVGDRVQAALKRVAANLELNDGRLAVVVSHGAALRLGMERMLGLREEQGGVLGPLSNCSWSVLGRRGSRWRILEHNAGTLPEPVLGDDR